MWLTSDHGYRQKWSKVSNKALLLVAPKTPKTSKTPKTIV